ncbi:diguanylate cyclase [Oleiagrimonas sp.]|jgi:diguanylate cyclase (GGDEF)-like protein|uniref:sensor domain-containing diguanylate cyclase n=1 Tax=Oleiagrimonas sp. TaxID=2010330 RepID=UPI00260B6157|nr:diguanylate cyclase [Oleiagrimonas sp.]MDA3913615.1 diguanylate cyclase [Oleiagrimonas sp.]
MLRTYAFLRSVLDTIPDHVAVIDTRGDIHFVNQNWVEFGRENACRVVPDWKGVNYLDACDKAAAMGDTFGMKAASGIRSVMASEADDFYFEYPCHSQDEKRWFMMRVTPFYMKGEPYYVVCHQNITERKIAEEKVLSLAFLDGLTHIPNRRYFDTFLDGEWKRCRRLNMPLSLVLIDLDHFKLLNDSYGHQQGDESLKLVGRLLKKYSRRPADACARYGGEEFAMVYGNTTLSQAGLLMEFLLEDIRSLQIPNAASPAAPVLTASIGLSSTIPGDVNRPQHLVKAADDLLYQAKENGRNQLASGRLGQVGLPRGGTS